ncbi:MAG TPA: hypothetical protein DCE11_05775 [Ruminiclostridium sp.]|jgi:two-component system chemotaxis sensor kinase CheA|nr:hypothetical protein [Clostridiaceae bacterium]HAA25613.1 hypothetical protein [Ruminiclostridium sp.]
MEHNNRANSHGISGGMDFELNQIKKNYINDFIQEILETLDSIELELVNLEVDPDNTEYLNSVYNIFISLKGLAGFLEKDEAVRLIEENEALIDACRKFRIPATRTFINVLLQTVLFLRRICNNSNIVKDTRFQGELEQHLTSVKQLHDEVMLDVKQPVRPPENRIGEILVEEGAMQENDINDVLEKQSNIYRKMKFGEIAVREKKLETGLLIKAIRAQKIRNVSGEQYVKIPLKQLDTILDITRCLEEAQQNLHNESVSRFGSDDAFTVELKKAGEMSSDIGKIIQELRLVTLQQSFQKITRAARAMIEETGIHVVFSTIGENTEIKKEIADEIVIPLAELIELILSIYRSRQGMDQEKLGNIELAAYSKNNSVIIEVSGNQIGSCESFAGSKKMDDIHGKIEKINGRIEFEDIKDGGCRVKIILPAD